MAWVITSQEMGLQNITEISATQRHTAAKVVSANDTTNNRGGEFIYLLGAANNAAGLISTYNASTGQTTLMASGANAGGPIAVAMAAVLATQWGWYQISGYATVLKTATQFTPAVKVYVSTTTGRVRSTASAGREILGARSANVATVTTTTSTILVAIDRPSLQGQIT